MTVISMADPVPHDRLGDVLVRQRRLSPHQVGVALDVQRRTRLPLGRILVETRVVSPVRLRLALWQQRLTRLFRIRRSVRSGQPVSCYGVDLVSWARARLERHLLTVPLESSLSPQEAEIIRLRSELAHFDPHATGRIVENDDVLRQRLLTGNF